MNTLALPMFASTSATERPGTFSKHSGPEKPAALRILGQKTEDMTYQRLGAWLRMGTLSSVGYSLEHRVKVDEPSPGVDNDIRSPLLIRTSLRVVRLAWRRPNHAILDDPARETFAEILREQDLPQRRSGFCGSHRVEAVRHGLQPLRRQPGLRGSYSSLVGGCSEVDDVAGVLQEDGYSC